MRAILKVFVIIVAAGAVLIGLSLLLPSYYSIASSSQIKAPVKTVYDQLSDFRKWSQWNVWDQRAGQTRSTVSDPSQGVGAWHGWKDSVNGDVKATITYQENEQALYYLLHFNDRGIVAIGSFQLQPDGQGTQITWTVADKLGLNPLKRWYGLFLALNTGGELDRALGNLKSVCEIRPAVSH